MSNVTFSNNFNYDYLNTNQRFVVPKEKSEIENLLNEFHKRETLLLTNLRNELDQNKNILKQDLMNVMSKYDNNNNIIYQKYSGSITQLFSALKHKSKELEDTL